MQEINADPSDAFGKAFVITGSAEKQNFICDKVNKCLIIMWHLIKIGEFKTISTIVTIGTPAFS